MQVNFTKKEIFYMKTNEKNVINEISKDLKFWEKIIVRMNKRLFIKIYKDGIRRGFKWNN